MNTELLVKRLLDSQAELQTALGMLRLQEDSYDNVYEYIEMRLQASLSMQHTLLADLGNPMYNATKMPEGWTPA
jgi:hypothetical protein